MDIVGAWAEGVRRAAENQDPEEKKGRTDHQGPFWL
jgi:hypothetical protein